MTDMEIARIVRSARRQGFDQACGVAFLGLVLTAPLLFLTDNVIGAASLLAAGVLGALGVASMLTNREPRED